MKNLDSNLIEEQLSAMGVDMRHRAMCKKILALKYEGVNIQEISRILDVNVRLICQILL